MSKKIYQVGSIQQMVDLNADQVNFHVSFAARSANAAPFQAVVVTQEDMDHGRLEYRDVVNGEISGDISETSGTYKSYQLALRSTEPTDVEVEIHLEKLEAEKPKDDLDNFNLEEFMKPPRGNWMPVLKIFCGAVMFVALLYLGSKYFKGKVAPEPDFRPMTFPRKFRLGTPVTPTTRVAPATPASTVASTVASAAASIAGSTPTSGKMDI